MSSVVCSILHSKKQNRVVYRSLITARSNSQRKFDMARPMSCRHNTRYRPPLTRAQRLTPGKKKKHDIHPLKLLDHEQRTGPRTDGSEQINYTYYTVGCLSNYAVDYLILSP